MEELNLTATDLATFAGASVAAGTITQFAKMLFNLGSGAIRVVALVSGLVLVVGATVLTTDVTNPLTLGLAALVGMQAGMSASNAFDLARAGISHEVVKVVPPPIPDAVVAEEEEVAGEGE